MVLRRCPQEISILAIGEEDGEEKRREGARNNKAIQLRMGEHLRGREGEGERGGRSAFNRAGRRLQRPAAVGGRQTTKCEGRGAGSKEREREGAKKPTPHPASELDIRDEGWQAGRERAKKRNEERI